MAKAGNYDIPYELSQDPLDYLFSEEVKKSEIHLKIKGGRFGESENILDDDMNVKASQTLAATGRKDFISNVKGELRDDHMDINTEDSRAEFDDDKILLDGDDFAFLKNEVLSERF